MLYCPARELHYNVSEYGVNVQCPAFLLPVLGLIGGVLESMHVISKAQLVRHCQFNA